MRLAPAHCTVLMVALATAAAACAPARAPASADVTFAPASTGEPRVFFQNLQALCGNAYQGVAIHAPAADTAFRTERLVMHVAHCSDTEIRIPLHVGNDRSRTWVLRLVGAGLELKHVHRHLDGSLDTNTNYGGTTSARGTPHRQEFPADAVSVAAVAARASQWWYLEHYPGARFTYGLFREESGLLYRVEFDLSAVVPTPPPAW